MRHRRLLDRRLSYLVVVDDDCGGDVCEFAAYLSDLGVAKCEVIVLDGSSEHTFARHRRVLCWVGRHVAARPRHRHLDGSIDAMRAALDLASCDKVIVADARVRYGAKALDDLCAMLDAHESVEPQDYFEPLPWWGGIEAGRMLVQRAVDPPSRGKTFAIRRSATRGLREIERMHARDVFVRRLPPNVGDWLDERPKQAGDDFHFPVKTALFLLLLPLAVILGIFGGMRLASGYASAIAFASVALAVCGRIGAAPFFPLRACLYAPLWVLERSVSVYWALFRRLRSSQFILRREAPEDLAPTKRSAGVSPATDGRLARP
jgi:hypothetical protein